MIRKNNAVLPFMLLLPFCAVLNAVEQIEIKAAGNLSYDEKAKRVTAEKDVDISSGNFRMTGQMMDIDLDNQFAIASGSVTLKDGESIIYGDRCEYFYSTSTGNVYGAYGYYYPWAFKGDKIFKSKEDLYMGKSQFTTCGLQHPHYYMSVKSAALRPGKSLVAKSAVVKIHDIPVFYYPTYKYSMGERMTSFDIYPGYNTYDGLILKGVYGFPVSMNSYSKLYLDWFQEQGIGKGLEYNYYDPDKIKGTTYLYHVKEEKNQMERWTVKSAHWQKLSPTWSMQGNLNYQSDEYFNKYYFAENWNRLSSDIRSDLAFTRQTSKTNLQLSINRTDVFDPAQNKYVIDQYTLPRLDLTVFQFKPKYSPVYMGLNTSLYRNYSRIGGTEAWNASVDCFVTQQYPVSIRTTITPRLGAVENWRLLMDTQTFVTNYYSALSLRQRINWFTHMEFTHNYRNRTMINSQETDFQANDFGIEANNLSALLYVSQKSSQYLRMGTSYDYRDFRVNNYPTNLSRLAALGTEVYTPLGSKLAVYMNHQYNVEFSSTASFQTEVTYAPSDRASFSMGYFYVATSTDGFQLNNQFNFWLGSKWLIALSLMSQVNGGDIRIIDERLKIYRTLHCWETSATYHKRGEIEEYFFNIGLKIPAPKAKSQAGYDAKHENEFYPWR